MLASSLGTKVLTMGFDAMGKGMGTGNGGTSCASIPPIVGTKVEKGSCGGAVGALGISGLSILRAPTLELAASKLFGTTLSITPFSFMSLLGCKVVVTLGANLGIGTPCQVKYSTSHSSIGSYSMANLSKNMGVKMIVCVTLRYTYNTLSLTIE